MKYWLLLAGRCGEKFYLWIEPSNLVILFPGLDLYFKLDAQYIALPMQWPLYFYSFNLVIPFQRAWTFCLRVSNSKIKSWENNTFFLTILITLKSWVLTVWRKLLVNNYIIKGISFNFKHSTRFPAVVVTLGFLLIPDYCRRLARYLWFERFI